MRKDHKESVLKEEYQLDGTMKMIDEGPPVRPVCDVSDGVSHKLSYLLSNMIEELTYGETVCNSTEEMLASIRKCNTNDSIQEEDVIGSADVKSLYPSIPIEDAIEIVVEEFVKKGVKVEAIDYEELGLYLVLNIEVNEIGRLGLEEVCPTRKVRNSRRPEITSSGVKVNKHERFEPWIKAKRTPNEEEKTIRVLLYS